MISLFPKVFYCKFLKFYDQNLIYAIEPGYYWLLAPLDISAVPSI